MQQAKATALLGFLTHDHSESLKGEKIKSGTMKNYFETTDGREYLVLTDKEANKAAADYIRDSVWAFRPEWLAEQTDLPIEVFEALGPTLYESANDAILKIIGDNFDDFVTEAIKADGRGHFLAGYDHTENEWRDYFIYRTN